MIQFYCPYCAAPIEVEDRAAGKAGRCPRCASKVSVPVPPGRTSAATTGRPPSSVELNTYQPSEVEFVADTVDVTVNLQGQLPDPTLRTRSTSSLGSKLRKRRSSSGRWLMPVLFGGLFLGVLAWLGRDNYHWESLTGTLPGVQLTELDLPAEVIPCNGSSLGAGELSDLLERLEQEPIILSGDLMQVQICGQSAGLSLAVHPGKQTVWYQVSPQQHADLQAYLLRESARLEQHRQAELIAARNEFLELVRRIHSGQGSVQDVVSFRDRLALPGLVGGFGHHISAVAGQRRYRCARETSDGTLYFLLPPGLTEFRVCGRDMAEPTATGASATVEADFLVKVSLATTESIRVTQPESAADTMAEEPLPNEDAEADPAMKARMSPEPE